MHDMQPRLGRRLAMDQSKRCPDLAAGRADAHAGDCDRLRMMHDMQPWPERRPQLMLMLTLMLAIDGV